MVHGLVASATSKGFYSADGNESLMYNTEINLQAVVDIYSAILIGQRLQVVPPRFSEEIVKLAIAKSSEARPKDFRGMQQFLFSINSRFRAWQA